MSQDYIALEWVKGEIEETLTQAQQALEAYVENPEDKSRLKFCLSYLHQIYGTLQMVEFYGAALLAEEMEALAAQLSDGKLESEHQALEILMQAIIQLPHYLEHVKIGRRDLPVVLLPILNELRSARGEALLSETALFAPTIRNNPPLTPAHIKAIESDDFIQWARKVRQMLQTATLQLLQGKQVDVAKEYLVRAFARLHKSLGATPQGLAWLPALAFAEWLQKQQHLPNSARQLLRQLDSLLKDTIEKGAPAVNTPAPAELIKNLLFYVARTEVRGDAIHQVQEQFNLRQALPSEEEIQQERDALNGPDRSTLENVLGALIEEIAAVKDRFDLLVRSEDDRISALGELVSNLKQISDTLGMLGLGMPRQLMQDQLAAVQKMLDSGSATDDVLLDVAGALLYIEATLSGMQREGNLSLNATESTLSDAHKALLREARNVIEQVKDAVVAYIGNQWETNELSNVSSLLRSVSGSMIMIPLPRVADILQSSALFVENKLLHVEAHPNWRVMDAFAEALTSVEYFLERYSENPNGASENFLERAEQSLLNLLGESLGDSKAIADVEFSMQENLPTVEVGEFSEVDDNEEEIALPSDTSLTLTDVIGGIDSDAIDFSAPNIESIALASPLISTVEPDNNLIPVTPTATVENDDLIDDEIIEIFLEEAGEVVDTLHEYWPQFKQNKQDQEAFVTVRRAFHTLKGSGRMVKAEFIGELAWSIENMLNRVLDFTITLSAPVVGIVDYVIDLAPALIDDFRQKKPASIEIQPIMDFAFALSRGEDPGSFTELTGRALPVLEDAPDASSDDDEDDALIEIFDGEARTHLQTIDEYVQLSRNEDYVNTLSDLVQRALHTLKGSAYMAGFDCVAHVAAPLEKLIKELRSYHIHNNRSITEALAEGSRLILTALNDRSILQSASIPGSQPFLETLAELEAELLADVDRESDGQRGPNPQAIARFMEHGMDSLLDADRLLGEWKQTHDNSILDNLQDDLRDVAGGAAEAELTYVQLLVENLNDFYCRAAEHAVDQSDAFVALAAEAHEALLVMLDCLAAGQDTQSPAAIIERLQSFEFINLDELTLVDEIPAIETISVENNSLTNTVIEKVDHTNPTISEDIFEISEESLVLAEPEIIKPASASEAERKRLVADTDDESNEARKPFVADDPELLDIFLEEAQEISESVEIALVRWRENPEDLLYVAQLQRELHTLKGGARMAELSVVADLCHELETLYENIHDGRLGVQPAVFQLLDRAHDELGVQLDDVRAGITPKAATQMIRSIRQYLTGVVDEEILDVTTDVIELPKSTEEIKAVAPISETLDESDREILEIFMEEAGELQEALDNALQAWQQEPDERAHPEEAQRVLHTLKGGARLAGLMRIGDLAHDFETEILHAQQGQIERDNVFFQDAHKHHDELSRLLDEVNTALLGSGVVVLGEPDITVVVPETKGVLPPDIEADFTSVEHEDDVALEPATNVVPLHSNNKQTRLDREASEPKSQQQGRTKAPQELVKVSADLLDSLVNLAGETSIGRGRLEQQVTDFAHTLEEMDMTLDRLRDQLRRLDMETEAQVLFRQERQGPTYEDFDPLEMDRYSTLQQLSRSLMESASDLHDLKETLSHKTRDAETLLLQQSRVNTELQEGLMKTRMVQFNRLVPRLRRIVRQVGQELGKQVELRVHNADGEMDRTILERMISPLEHMVRNAVDHGIENREQRAAAGKSSTGYVDLEVSRDGGDVVITMTDDGRGVNLPAVRKKAIERGLMTADANLSDHEIMQFILQAGFSTAETITQISGRGVGMDVVASEIKQMGGSVDVQSETGVGTRFIVRLPFTVSVNRALMVKVGDDLYAVPLNNIQGIVRIPASQLQALYNQPNAERRYEYAGTQYQIEYLGVTLDNEASPKFSTQTLPVPVLLVRGPIPFALQVDNLLGSREIVVKTLGPQFSGVMGVSGGTILGDGSVVIILDLPAMIRTQVSIEYQQARALDHQEAERRHEMEKRLPRILVVDDSVTVRKVTTRLLERNGMEVFTAKDGVDAIATLQDHKPDLMLLDIEMPRMDGFEVASRVRHDSRLKDIPIIMITSRTGDKHRERAMSIGVNEYLGKPFQEDLLLATMNRLLGRGEG